MRIHPKKPETYVVAGFTQDVVENAGQDYHLSEGYRWIRPEWYFRLWSAVSFRLVRFFGGIYCRFALHASIKNRAVLKPYRKTGFFLYGNHTQPFGDVVLPALAVWPKRIYTIGSPANLGIPGLGKLLPAVGILPTPENFGQTKRFWAAIRQRAAEGCCVVTFPEAHVWPYYTEIRPFPEGSFRFPGTFPNCIPWSWGIIWWVPAMTTLLKTHRPLSITLRTQWAFPSGGTSIPGCW